MRHGSDSKGGTHHEITILKVAEKVRGGGGEKLMSLTWIVILKNYLRYDNIKTVNRCDTNILMVYKIKTKHIINFP